MHIYKITNNIDNKVYIGMTTKSVLNRFQRHCVIARTTNTHNKKYLHRAMMKHGVHNFSVITLESCESLEELRVRESYWISVFNSMNKKFGYNLTAGGDGVSGYIRTPECTAKIVKGNTGRVQSDEEKQRRSATMLGLIVRDTSLINLRAHSISKSIPVVKLDDNFNVIAKYSSVNVARVDIDFKCGVYNHLIKKNKSMFIVNGNIWMLDIKK